MRAWAWVAALLASACIEPRIPFDAQDRDPGTGELLTRLTYNTGDDRWPSWTPDGSSVLYVAETQSLRGTLLALPGDGLAGTEPVFRGLPNFPWLVAPRQAPTSERVAYIEVANAQAPCGGRSGVVTSCTPVPWQPFSPVLLELRLRVRDRAATGFVGSDPALVIHTDALRIEGERDGFPREVLTFEPWHTAFHTDGTWGLRPDWSPDGCRVVFSDGTALWIWDVDEPAAPLVMIPGTQDGISPAWRPDGEWVAYTRLVRGAATTGICTGVIPGWGPACTLDQHIVNVAERLLVLARPDGSDEQVLGPGDDPAWGPDGSLYYRHANQLWRHGPEPEALPGTTGGREPAVSPDGRRLVFSFRNENGKHDLWVLRLDP